MKAIRDFVDGAYDFAKPAIFLMDPERAHERFTNFARIIHYVGLEKFLLDANEETNGIKISNAAGFNKNGLIPPTFLKWLGFDRVVVGTVTGEPYAGNPRPRIKRFPEDNSLINWMGLPGYGAEIVAEIMNDYGEHGVEISVNLSPTPKIKSEKIPEDLEKSVLATRGLHKVGRYVLNISCPNNGEEEMRKYISQLREMLRAVKESKYDVQELYLKVSPDLTETDVEEIIKVSKEFGVKGFVTTNTTTKHGYDMSKHIPAGIGNGGASGNAVYGKSCNVQRMFYEKTKSSGIKIVPCGGISSRFRMQSRVYGNISEMQIFTPLIYEGPKLLRDLKSNSMHFTTWQ